MKLALPPSGQLGTEARKAYWTCLKPEGSHLRQFFRLEAAEKDLGRAGKPSLVTWDFGVDTTSLQSC